MSHEDYLSHLSHYLAMRIYDKTFSKQLQSHTKELIILAHLDLDPAVKALEKLYSPNKGPPPRDPVCMLRSLILMTIKRESSVTKWVQTTRSLDLLAILTGFDPEDTPGIGTYYDFLWRLVDGQWQKSCPHRVKPSKFHRGKHIRNLKGEKQAKKEKQDPHHSQSAQLVKELLRDTDLPRIDEMQKILEDLLIHIGIMPSIKEGILKDLENLTVSGDGSILESAASGAGKPTCSCRAEGIYRCDCDRIYRSATAKWCYDHHKDTYIFGDRYYHLVVTQNGHDLPLLTIMPGGDESDYTLSLKAFDRLLKAIRENGLDVRIKIFCGDGHHDSYAHYEYFEKKDVIPVIPLSEGSQKSYPHLLEDRGIKTDTDGTPLCPAGLRMRYHQFNKAKRAHVFACPVKRNTHRDGKSIYIAHENECPRERICEPEKLLSPIVTIKSDTDPRLYPPIARNSTRFEEIRNQRSASERCNSVNDSYHLDRSSRNPAHGLIRLTLANIVEHAVIRYMERVKKSSVQQVFEQTLNQILTIKEYQDTG